MSKFYLINTEKSDDTQHYKFWSGYIEKLDSSKFIVHTSWGRIGTRGQSKDYEYPRLPPADTLLATKISDKIRSGYVKVEERKFNLLCNYASLIGSKVPVRGVEWAVIEGRYVRLIKNVSYLEDPSYLPGIVVSFIVGDIEYYLLFGDNTPLLATCKTGPYSDTFTTPELRSVRDKIVLALTTVGV